MFSPEVPSTVSVNYLKDREKLSFTTVGTVFSIHLPTVSRGAAAMVYRPRKWIVSLAVFVFLAAAVVAGPGDVSCFYCGMKRSEYGHSWVVVSYDDHSTGEFCSLHCASIDMVLHTEKTAVTVLVGDYYTKKLIDADKAHWVIGGSKTGVMTTRAKWAFATKDAAISYMQAFGGEPGTLTTAIKAAFEDMYEDIMMIHRKREMMRKKKMEGNS
jgi:nitrous oxide reductase accessory protein NosL